MADRLLFTVLGCGSSPGVPRIGGHWGECDPSNPRNRRRRCSMLVQRISGAGTTNVLVDTSPDIREQALDVGIGTLDGVLYTHSHADHIHGIDDLRAFAINMKRCVDLYADAQTMARLRQAFDYCFQTPSGSEYPPIVSGHVIEAGTEVSIDGPGGPVTAMPITQQHGRITSLAFRFGGLAYSPDVSGLTDHAIAQLHGLDVWIVDALRRTPHPSHFSLPEALDWIGRVQPKHAVLTHMHIDLDYATLRHELPQNVEPAYDGMQITLAG